MQRIPKEHILGTCSCKNEQGNLELSLKQAHFWKWLPRTNHYAHETRIEILCKIPVSILRDLSPRPRNHRQTSEYSFLAWMSMLILCHGIYHSIFLSSYCIIPQPAWYFLTFYFSNLVNPVYEMTETPSNSLHDWCTDLEGMSPFIFSFCIHLEHRRQDWTWLSVDPPNQGMDTDG